MLKKLTLLQLPIVLQQCIAIRFEYVCARICESPKWNQPTSWTDETRTLSSHRNGALTSAFQALTKWQLGVGGTKEEGGEEDSVVVEGTCCTAHLNGNF